MFEFLNQITKSIFTFTANDSSSTNLLNHPTNGLDQTIAYKITYTSKSNEDFYCPYEFNRNISNDDIESKGNQMLIPAKGLYNK